MRKHFYLLSFILILFACSKEVNTTPEPEPVQIPKYTVSITAGDGGTISSAGGTYDKDTQISITATPNAEYLFQAWSDGNTDNPRSIKVTADLTITANFVKKQYDLTVNVVGEGAVAEEVVIQGGRYNSGSQIKLTATAAQGWEFIGWSGAIESTDNPVTVNINEGKEVTATFTRKKYNLNITIEGEGTVTEEVVVQPGQYDYETQVKLTAVPEEGWEFTSWSGAIDSTDNPITITVDEAKGLTARFVPSVNGVSSTVELCKLENLYPNRGYGFPLNPFALRAKGDLKMTLIFIDFEDSQATKSIDEVYDILSPISSDFFYNSSYGNLNLEFDVIDKWYRMSKNADAYNMSRDNSTALSHKEYLQEALSLADVDYDFSQSDAFAVITNPDTQEVDFGPALVGNDYWNLKSEEKTFYTSTNSGYDLYYWGGLWLNHEVFHNMGLPDLYKYGGDPTWHGLVGRFSIMGLISGEAPDLFGYSKWMLDWVKDSQVFCAESGTGVIDISPIELFQGETKIVVLPLSNTKAVVLESRRAIGLDSNLPNDGVLVYLVNTSIPGGTGVIKVLPEDNYDEVKLNVLLGEGDELYYEDYNIKVVYSDPSFDRVVITKN